MPTRRLALLTILIAVVKLPDARADVRVEGQTFPARAQVGERELVLNGVGLRAVAWLKGYAAGLYLTSAAASADGVVAMGGPKRLQMRMLQDVPAAEFVKAVDKGFGRNTPAGQQAALAERRDAFGRQILALGSVKKGDVVDLDFVPGSGLVMAVNGRVHGTPVAGEDFYGALLRIFVGEHPVDPKLKAGLLGRRAPP
jgi:Chalcone isomerase-like